MLLDASRRPNQSTDALFSFEDEKVIQAFEIIQKETGVPFTE
jgi:hypothetical protein